MPNTTQTYSGSHEFSPRDCEECHEDQTIKGSAMQDMLCIDCHKNQEGSHFILPLCNDCHSNSPTLSDNDEVHKNIVLKAQDSTVLKGQNEACFICHANANVKINNNRPQYIEFDIINISNNWMIQNLTEGPIISQEITIHKEGKSHKWISGSEVKCSSCHPDINGQSSAHYPSSYPSPVHLQNAPCENCHEKIPYQHAAKLISCTDANCHTEHAGNLISQISEQPDQYQSNICIGCHNQDHVITFPPESTITHYIVYLEHV